jgi:hypothetical protein
MDLSSLSSLPCQLTTLLLQLESKSTAINQTKNAVFSNKMTSFNKTQEQLKEFPS